MRISYQDLYQLNSGSSLSFCSLTSSCDADSTPFPDASESAETVSWRATSVATLRMVLVLLVVAGSIRAHLSLFRQRKRGDFAAAALLVFELGVKESKHGGAVMITAVARKAWEVVDFILVHGRSRTYRYGRGLQGVSKILRPPHRARCFCSDTEKNLCCRQGIFHTVARARTGEWLNILRVRVSLSKYPFVRVTDIGGVE